jgi:hypothetical protein
MDDRFASQRKPGLTGRKEAPTYGEVQPSQPARHPQRPVRPPFRAQVAAVQSFVRIQSSSMSLPSRPLGLLRTARGSPDSGLAATATRLLRLSCREPPIHDADPSVQLAGDFIDRHPGGAQAVGLLDPASIMGDSTASAAKFGIRPFSRANGTRDFKGRAAAGTFHESLELVDREGELQP